MLPVCFFWRTAYRSLIRRCNSGGDLCCNIYSHTIILESLPKPGDDTRIPGSSDTSSWARLWASFLHGRLLKSCLFNNKGERFDRTLKGPVFPLFTERLHDSRATVDALTCYRVHSSSVKSHSRKQCIVATKAREEIVKRPFERRTCRPKPGLTRSKTFDAFASIEADRNYADHIECCTLLHAQYCYSSHRRSWP
ncbi:hypothetical protein AVEN_137617-1 [Araneus ventricosus]|uniref:Uncharacterized protein n=1 Tax=Araneus ventricosus TaxID=182803 RepID=A0A4Y2CUI1_ARAVE|nr:hypothetical protein AVEN_137617-1 [Araneus ventricosus]